MARPVLASEEAATGIDATDGQHWRICRDDVAFERAILDLSADTSQATEMGRAARRFVVENMSWEAVEAGLADILGQAEARHHDAA